MLIVLGVSLMLAAGGLSSGKTEFSLNVVAGSENDLMIVRHLTLRGSNEWIGEKLGEIARSQHHTQLAKLDPSVGPDQLRWLTENYPERMARAAGVRKAYGLPETSAYNTTELPVDLAARFGCSVVYYPGSSVTNHHAMLSRNYDFWKASFGEIFAGKAVPSARSMTGDPYVIEMHPDQGFASLYLCAYDLEGGAIDGVNSKGVSVALLADDLSAPRTRGRAGYGLSELDLPRFVLDRCGSAADARRLLKDAPYSATLTPCHYMIGDASGDSFIFEVGPDGTHYFIDGKGKPQVVTNHSIAEYGTENLPAGDSFDRYRRLEGELDKRSGSFTPNEVKQINYCVAVPEDVRVHGTLWHSVYDLKDRSLQVSFCLSKADESTERRTPYLRFKLSE